VRAYAVAYHRETAAIQTVTHYRFDAILWVALAALAADAGRLRRHAIARRLVLATSLGALSVGPIMSGTTLQYSVRFLAVALLSVSLTAEVVLAPETWLARAFHFTPLRAIGRVSYGMYLIHLQVIDLVVPRAIAAYKTASFGAYVGTTGAVLVFSFGAAWIMYILYERPFLALKRRFTPRRLPALVAAASQ
jgi:peptidoglycan/LPS O-acetylase OafA/YrhL